MDEKEVLISHCLDLKKKASDSFMITCTGFLSVDERSVVSAIQREYASDIDTFYYGGYEDAERTVAVYVPKLFGVTDIDKYFADNTYDNPLSLIKISKDRFSTLSHRDYLGALMGLGIKRETVGDIIVGCDDCFVFSLKNMSNFICENFSKAGRGRVDCEIADLTEFAVGNDNTQTVFSSVASLRLDSVVSSSFNLSRGASSDVIKRGLVYVNSVQLMKGDALLKEGDKIVLRGKGKVVLEKVIGESKKGRIHINLKKYR